MLDLPPVPEPERRGWLGNQAATPLLQTAALLRGTEHSWADQTDKTLLAQGRVSAQGAALSARFVFPDLPGLSDPLARPGAQMLDVGTGVAGMAVASAECWPALTVVGLDVLHRALALPAVTVAGSAVAERVVVGDQDVATLDQPAP